LEAQSLKPRAPVAATRSLALARRYIGRWGLIIALAALPVYYGLHDLIHGYQAGLHNGQPIIRHDLTQLGANLLAGLSNGSIWAMIAMGYTLVYGIIELINFAHGDVFTMGSFTAVG
jgi:branched-chain amino acid transport system permease protein